MRRFRVVLLASLLAALPSSVLAEDDAEERRLVGLALDRMIAGQNRVMAIAERMRIAGAELCGRKVAPVLGIYSADRDTFRDLYLHLDHFDSFFETAEARFGLGDEPRVLAVVPGLPAEASGILVGDVIVGVDGSEPRMRGDLQLKAKHVRDAVVRVDLLREGRPVRIEVPAKLGCEVASRFMFGAAIDAFAMRFGNLTGVYFFGGMLRFAPDDDELAVVVGHEFAHLVLGHAGHLRVSRRYEAEADHLGLYFAARSGYDVSKAPIFWDRMSRSNPYSSITRGYYSHPMSAARSIALMATIEEIDEKRAKGAALTPDEGRLALDLPEVPEAQVEAHTLRLRKETLDTLRAEQARVADVSYRLAVGAVESCVERVAAQLGAVVGRRQDFGHSRKKQVKEAFGAGDEVTVFAVARDSPAERAGLRTGDRIVAIDGHRVKKSRHVFDRMRNADEPVSVRVSRGAEEIELTIPYVPGCGFGTMVHPSSSADTGHHKNRKEMIVGTALLRFVRDDDELAIAISHQLAHQIGGHFRSAKQEPDADALGLRIAARAGFDVSKAPRFWDRWAAEQFWKIPSDMDGDYIPHGAMAWRAPVIRETSAEIVAVGSGG